MEELEDHQIVFATPNQYHFDTVAIKVTESGFLSADYVLAEFNKYGINLRKVDNDYKSYSMSYTICTILIR